MGYHYFRKPPYKFCWWIFSRPVGQKPTNCCQGWGREEVCTYQWSKFYRWLGIRGFFEALANFFRRFSRVQGLNRLRLVVYPIISGVLYIPGVVLRLFYFDPKLAQKEAVGRKFKISLCQVLARRFNWKKDRVVFWNIWLWHCSNEIENQYRTRWWFQIFLFSPLFGEDSQFWLIFFKWVGSTTNQRKNLWFNP